MPVKPRRISRTINLGGLWIGGTAPISVQSMTNTDTRDVAGTVKQILALEQAGCEVVRLAVPDTKAARSLADIKRQTHVPLVADIHFNFRLALLALEAGIDGLRINPGNIGGPEKISQVVKEAARREVPIRVGVNAGSLEKEILSRYGRVTAEAMAESALGHIRLLEELGFSLIKVSLKASDVPLMIEAYETLAEKVPYPLHLGVTEAGTPFGGTIKSAVGIGHLLAEGIGDTIRVSLTGDPVQEVRVGFEILKTLGLRQKGVEIIACPTCGRCQIDLESIALEVENRLADFNLPLKIAVMGCPVNGPGEARQADLGIAGGNGVGLVFRKGQVVKKVPQEELVAALLQEVEQLDKLNS